MQEAKQRERPRTEQNREQDYYHQSHEQQPRPRQEAHQQQPQVLQGLYVEVTWGYHLLDHNPDSPREHPPPTATIESTAELLLLLAVQAKHLIQAAHVISSATSTPK